MSSRAAVILSAQEADLKLELRCKPLLKMGKAMLCSIWRVVLRCQDLVTFYTIAFNHLGDGPLLQFLYSEQGREKKMNLLSASHYKSSVWCQVAFWQTAM